MVAVGRRTVPPPPPVLGPAPAFSPDTKVTMGPTKDCRGERDLAQMQEDSATGIVLSSLVPGLV